MARLLPVVSVTYAISPQVKFFSFSSKNNTELPVSTYWQRRRLSTKFYYFFPRWFSAQAHSTPRRSWCLVESVPRNRELYPDCPDRTLINQWHCEFQMHCIWNRILKFAPIWKNVKNIFVFTYYFKNIFRKFILKWWCIKKVQYLKPFNIKEKAKIWKDER